MVVSWLSVPGGSGSVVVGSAMVSSAACATSRSTVFPSPSVTLSRNGLCSTTTRAPPASTTSGSSAGAARAPVAGAATDVSGTRASASAEAARAAVMRDTAAAYDTSVLRTIFVG